MIETYKDLHPDEDDKKIQKIHVKYEKEQALKKIRKGYYENKFSKSEGKKITGHGKGQSTLCVYGDT
tara:strand:- start:1613 stop:1813 length:201 start_codon:yes stop_codon:yes gene_type:complete